MKTSNYPKTPFKRNPILYWQAISRNGEVIDQNNSIAILRYKYGNSVLYTTIR